MRFEPRLIRPDDEPADQPELPADLEALAEQLSADADYLAARYPAPSEPSTAERGRRMLRGAAAAVLLTGLGLWGGRLWHAAAHRPRGAAPLPNVQLASEDLGATPHARQLADDDAGASPAANVFHGLTGAEREGLLDLLEEQPLDETQVSI